MKCMLYKNIVFFTLGAVMSFVSLPLMADDPPAFGGEDFQSSTEKPPQSENTPVYQGTRPPPGREQHSQASEPYHGGMGETMFPDINVDEFERRLDAIEQNDAQRQADTMALNQSTRLKKLFGRLRIIIARNAAYIRDWHSERGYECIVGQEAARQLGEDIVDMRQQEVSIQKECQGAMGPSLRKYCQEELAKIQGEIRYLEQFKVEFQSQCNH